MLLALVRRRRTIKKNNPLLLYIYSIYKRLTNTIKGAIFIYLVPNPK